MYEGCGKRHLAWSGYDIIMLLNDPTAARYCIMSHPKGKQEMTWNWDYWLHRTLDLNKTYANI